MIEAALSQAAEWHRTMGLHSGGRETADLLICVSRRGGRKLCVVSKTADQIGSDRRLDKSAQ